MWLLKEIIVALLILGLCFAGVYISVAYPWLSIEEVWETRGSADGGALVFVFTFIAFVAIWALQYFLRKGR